MIKLVTIESPYAGNVEDNISYAKDCMLDSLNRGEAPFASHLLYTQILDDSIPEQRELGIKAGLEWAHMTDYVVFYTDLGWSKGMLLAKKFYDDNDINYIERTIHSNNS